MCVGGGGGRLSSRKYLIKKGGHLLFTWSAAGGAYTNFDLSNIFNINNDRSLTLSRTFKRQSP